MFNEVNRRIEANRRRMKLFRRLFWVFFVACLIAAIVILIGMGVQAVRLVDWIVTK